MVSRLPSAALAGALLLLATAARAAEPPASPPSAADRARLQAETEVFLRAVVVRTQVMAAWIDREGDFLLELQDGVGQAIDYANSQDAAGGAAWAAQWAPARLAELSALEQNRPDLPPAPAPADFQGVPRVQRLVRSMAATGELARRQVAADHALARRLIDLVARTAGGDLEATAELARHALDTGEAILAGEIAILRASAEGQVDGHPQKDVIASSLAAELAVQAVMERAKATLLDDGPAPVPGPLAAGVRAHAETVRASAAAMPDHAAKMLAAMRASPELGPEQFARVEKAFATYGENAELDGRLAGLLSHMADRIEAGDAMDAPELSATLERIYALNEKRSALDAERRRAIAGS